MALERRRKPPRHGGSAHHGDAAEPGGPSDEPDSTDAKVAKGHRIADEDARRKAAERAAELLARLRKL